MTMGPRGQGRQPDGPCDPCSFSGGKITGKNGGIHGFMAFYPRKTDGFP